MDEVGTNGSAISEQKMETTTVYLVLYWLNLVILSRLRESAVVRRANHGPIVAGAPVT